jgi:hypothetical protein
MNQASQLLFVTQQYKLVIAFAKVDLPLLRLLQVKRHAKGVGRDTANAAAPGHIERMATLILAAFLRGGVVVGG